MPIHPVPWTCRANVPLIRVTCEELSALCKSLSLLSASHEESTDLDTRLSVSPSLGHWKKGKEARELMLKVIPSGRTDRSHDDLHKVTTDDVHDDAITRLQRIICDETQPYQKFQKWGKRDYAPLPITEHSGQHYFKLVDDNLPLGGRTVLGSSIPLVGKKNTVRVV